MEGFLCGGLAVLSLDSLENTELQAHWRRGFWDGLASRMYAPPGALFETPGPRATPLQLLTARSRPPHPQFPQPPSKTHSPATSETNHGERTLPLRERLTLRTHWARLRPARLRPTPPSRGFSPWRMRRTRFGKLGRNGAASISLSAEEGSARDAAEARRARRAVERGRRILSLSWRSWD